MREGGIDFTRIGALTEDRDKWRATVRERMNYLYDWEKKGAKSYQGERGPRNQPVSESLTCEYQGCNKTFKSKAGLTIHRKRIHEVSKNKVMFKCVKCEEEFSQEANLKNHKKICTGLKASSTDFRKCDKCLREFKKAGFNRHYKNCNQGQGIQREQVVATVYVSERGPCSLCGQMITLSNMSRHQKVCVRRTALS